MEHQANYYGSTSEEDLKKPSLRFSFSKYNTTKELDYTIGVLKDFMES